MEYDYLIVGAGFAGSVVAERLARGAGRRVLLVDRRPHLGGNAHDRLDAHGILVHAYGPHIFHTNSRAVFEYLSRFTRWRAYEHRVLASVDGRLLPFPINLDTVNGLYGLDLREEQLEAWFAARAERVERVRTSEDAVVSRVGRDLYERFFRGYTRKQWGLDPGELDASVAARVPARTDRDDRYFTDTWQAMPAQGYTRLFENLLDDPRIDVRLGVDWRDAARDARWRELVYTGPIDAYFDHRFGPLPYRSLDFRFETLPVPRHQPVGTINHPDERVPYTRVTEFTHLTGQVARCTTLAYEHPRADGDPYYPVPRPANAELYQRYRALAEALPGVHFCGRLATYRYYNMDQVVAQALTLGERLAAAPPGPPAAR